MNKKILMSTVVLLVVAMLATSIGAVLARPFYQDISVEKANRMIFSKGHHDLVVIDIRPVFMYTGGHIPGAINEPSLTLPAWIAGAGQSYLNNKIIVHCYLGFTSPDAADLLIEAGFKKVYNMEGGFKAWSDAEYPTVP